MGDRDKVNLTDTDIIFDNLMNTTSLVEAISLLARDPEEPESSEPTSGD